MVPKWYQKNSEDFKKHCMGMNFHGITCCFHSLVRSFLAYSSSVNFRRGRAAFSGSLLRNKEQPVARVLRRLCNDSYVTA